MRKLFSLILLLWMDLRVNGQDKIMNIFIKDLIATFKFTSPTILYDSDEGLPEICHTSQWVLCLSSDQHERDLKVLQDKPENHRDLENNGMQI